MKSVISISMPKAGSTVADRIFAEFCKMRGYAVNNLARHVPKSSLPSAEVYLQQQKTIKPSGFYYGMVREPVIRRMSVIPKLRAVFQVRDPRDCITSAYFSFGGSHRLPVNPEKRERFLARRDEIQAMGIDSFALHSVRKYAWRMNVILDVYESHPDALLLRYEDMVTDTEAWLQRIAEFLKQPLTPVLRARICDDLDFRPSSEDASRHKRQVRPGDHKRKLKPETILEMNGILRPALKRFQYAD